VTIIAFQLAFSDCLQSFDTVG